jgi:hypothetical protein
MAAYKLNAKAYHYLILACQKTSFPFVKNAKTAALKHDDAHLAWTDLESMYEPKKSRDLIALEQAYNQLTLDSFDNYPETWMQTLEYFELRLLSFDEVKTDELKMARILSGLPEDHSEFVTTLESKDLTVGSLGDIKADIRKIWLRKHLNHTRGGEDFGRKDRQSGMFLI